MDQPVVNSHDSDLASPSQYSLTVQEASDLFLDAEVPRSPRTIIRYCARGHLDCIKVDTEQNEKYLITRESVDRRIKEIRQVARSSQVSTQRDESRHDAPRHDSGEPPEEHSEWRDAKLKSLESEIVDLKITNRAKDHFIEQLQSDRALLVDQIAKQGRQIGQLETRLELQAGVSADQLTAPSEPPPEPSSNAPERSAADPPGPSPTGESAPETSHEP